MLVHRVKSPTIAPDALLRQLCVYHVGETTRWMMLTLLPEPGTLDDWWRDLLYLEIVAKSRRTPGVSVKKDLSLGCGASGTIDLALTSAAGTSRFGDTSPWILLQASVLRDLPDDARSVEGGVVGRLATQANSLLAANEGTIGLSVSRHSGKWMTWLLPAGFDSPQVLMERVLESSSVGGLTPDEKKRIVRSFCGSYILGNRYGLALFQFPAETSRDP